MPRRETDISLRATIVALKKREISQFHKFHGSPIVPPQPSALLKVLAAVND